MTERLRVILLVVMLTLFAVGLASAALMSKGLDGKTYLSLDENEVETLGARMQLMGMEIERLKAQRKTECGLI